MSLGLDDGDEVFQLRTVHASWGGVHRRSNTWMATSTVQSQPTLFIYGTSRSQPHSDQLSCSRFNTYSNHSINAKHSKRMIQTEQPDSSRTASFTQSHPNSNRGAKTEVSRQSIQQPTPNVTSFKPVPFHSSLVISFQTQLREKLPSELRLRLQTPQLPLHQRPQGRPRQSRP